MRLLAYLEDLEDMDMDKAKVVLDTNVLLDIFVFKDPTALAIWDFIKDGSLELFYSAETLEEFKNLLGDKKFSLSEDEQKAALADFLSKSSLVVPNKVFPVRCHDPFDQMFFELALAVVPSYLVTLDKAVLKLRKRSQKEGFSVLTPEKFLSMVDSMRNGQDVGPNKTSLSLS